MGGDIVGGIGLLVGLWCDAFSVFEEDLSDTSRALVIVAGVAMMNLELVASFMHSYVDGCAKAAFPGTMAVVSLIFVLMRVFMVEPRAWESQMLATWLSAAAAAAAAGAPALALALLKWFLWWC